ncbi:MAG: aminotransferase class I/II-fold pyridoxal phosphate-dependent enzyme [Muribaculaceae bacterium]|nr:aminotransferase class I/II-fold pyridoxal phosphate-dependent enzyme [Muribaculaceae bacterium]
MIEGHGDDLYRYKNIKMNFSSNIYAGTDLSALETYLCSHMDVVRSYPEPSAASLEMMIAHECGISPDEVLVTSGAVDAIYLIAQAYRHEGSCHVIQPTFREYEDACRVFGYQEREDGALCWLCNPNNPTGDVMAVEDVLALAKRHHLLVVDQSYEDYTMAPLLPPADVVGRDDIILLHSMTKRYAVPGLRLGYVTASARIISHLREQYRPWAINALSLEAGKWLVSHDAVAIKDLPSYLGETERLRTMLNEIDGIEAFDTQTNFFLCTIKRATAAELKDYLALEHGILIRDASNFTSLTPHHFRIATQSPAENDALIDAIQQFTAQ